MQLEYMSVPELRAYARFVNEIADIRAAGVESGKALQRQLVQEAVVDRIEDAIEAQAKAAKVVEKAAAEAVTVETLRALAGKADREKVRALLTKHGVKAFTALPPESYPAVKAELEAL